MKKVKQLIPLFIVLICGAILLSCKKDKTEGNGYNVEYKISTSANAVIGTVIHTNAQGDPTTATNVGGTSWSAKVNVQAGVPAISLGGNGATTSGNGSMTVQIYIDGKLVKENSASGSVLSATTTYIPN